MDSQLTEPTCEKCGGTGEIAVLDGGTMARPKGLPLPTYPCPACSEESS